MTESELHDIRYRNEVRIALKQKATAGPWGPWEVAARNDPVEHDIDTLLTEIDRLRDWIKLGLSPHDAGCTSKFGKCGCTYCISRDEVLGEPNPFARK